MANQTRWNQVANISLIGLPSTPMLPGSRNKIATTSVKRQDSLITIFAGSLATVSQWSLTEQPTFLVMDCATISGGVFINRPSRGNAYVGIRSIHGPISSDVLMGSYSYRLSPKWISTAGASFDFSDAGNIGQSFSMTRIGESMLVTLGVNVDSAKDNVGFRFLVEPRFLPKLRLTSTTGIDVPPCWCLWT